MSERLKFNGSPATQFVVVSRGGNVFIVARTEAKKYFRLAIITNPETESTIEAIAQVLTIGYPVEIVSLGIIENDKFISEEVSEPFLSEIDLIQQACLQCF